MADYISPTYPLYLKMNYLTLADINKDTIELLSMIPPNIDMIVGIPRDGLLVATLIALYRNLPFTDVEGFIAKRIFRPGIKHRKGFDFDSAKNILLVDDICFSGRALTEAIGEISALNRDINLFSAVLYIYPDKVYIKGFPDFYVRKIPRPSQYEWYFGEPFKMANSLVDIDGILCPNPTKAQDDGGEKYIDFLKNTPLKFKPEGINTIITGRLEKYRALTEEWLAKQGITYQKLIMRQEGEDHANFKARHYRKSINRLFFESSDSLAQRIAQLSGKPVIAFETNKIYRR